MRQSYLRIVFLLLIVGCGGGLEVPLYFDSNFPDRYKILIQGSFRELANLQLAEDPAEAQKLSLPNFQKESVAQWYRDRVKILVLADSLKEKAKKDDGNILMVNLGAGLFADGLETGTPILVKVSDRRVYVDTPRVGIIGVFSEVFQFLRLRPDSMGNFIFLLGVLAHEGRHSDGLGMFHSICKKGALAGKAACDASDNGPYRVGASFTKKMLTACGNQCTPREQGILRAEIADMETRFSYSAPSADVTPRRIVQR